MQTVETLGKNLVDLREALLEVNRIMHEPKNPGETKGEKLSVRVYKQHRYAPNKEDYSKNKKILSEIEGDIRSLIIDNFDKYTPKRDDTYISWIIDKIREGFLEYEDLNAMNDLFNIKKDSFPAKNIIISATSSLYPKLLNGSAVVDSILAKVQGEYIKSLDYVYNKSGYIAGIYRNNGETDFFKKRTVFKGEEFIENKKI